MSLLATFFWFLFLLFLEGASDPGVLPNWERPSSPELRASTVAARFKISLNIVSFLASSSQTSSSFLDTVGSDLGTGVLAAVLGAGTAAFGVAFGGATGTADLAGGGGVGGALETVGLATLVQLVSGLLVLPSPTFCFFPALDLAALATRPFGVFCPPLLSFST